MKLLLDLLLCVLACAAVAYCLIAVPGGAMVTIPLALVSMTLASLAIIRVLSYAWSR